MKITFTFVNLPDLASATQYDLWRTHCEFPDEALALPDYRERLEAIAQLAGQLTQASMYVTCAEMDWKMKPICSAQDVQYRSVWQTAVLGFERTGRARKRLPQYKYLKILYARWLPDMRTRLYGRRRGSVNAKLSTDIPTHPGELHANYLAAKQIGEHCLILLTADPNGRVRYMGYHPFWHDNATSTQFGKRVKAQIVAEEREKKAKKRQEARAEKAVQPKTGHVYFIQQGSDGPIKIGYSVDPQKRLRALKTASPRALTLLKVVEGSQKLEKDIHARFAEIQLDGEWFQPTKMLLDYIEALE